MFTFVMSSSSVMRLIAAVGICPGSGDRMGPPPLWGGDANVDHGGIAPSPRRGRPRLPPSGMTLRRGWRLRTSR